MNNRRRSPAAVLALCAAALFALALLPGAALAAFGPPAGPISPPFWQCPAVGNSTSCAFLVDVTGSGSSQQATVYADPSQEFYDVGKDDEVVAVQNDSSTALASIHLGIAGSGDNLFGFEGDGLCNPGVGARPAGCPFGGTSNTSDPYDYYGPDMNFQPGYSPDDGTINFTPALQPGQYTFFALDSPLPQTQSQVVIPVGSANDYLTTTLTDSTSSGQYISSASPTDVTDQATIVGPNAYNAQGTMSYAVYSDPHCTNLVASSPAQSFNSNGGTVPASIPIGANLPANAVYYWQATFTSSDTSSTGNSSVTSQCGEETMTFGTPPPRSQSGIQTTLTGGGHSGASVTVPAGTPVTDAATLTGPSAATATGTVTYAVFSNSLCSSQVNAYSPHGDVRGVSGGSAPASAAVTLPLGTYYFRATYSGDSSHAPAVGACGAEILRVIPAPSIPARIVAKAKASGMSTVNSVRTNYAGTIKILATVANARALGKHTRKCGKARVLVGRRCISTRFGTASVRKSRSGSFVLRVKPSPIARKALAAGKTLHISETITLVPSNAQVRPARVTLHVTLKGKPHRKRKKH